jgi:hypothetical protein
MPSTSASIKVVKSFPFKGGTRNFSNRYHFIGGTPADAAHWTVLADSVTNQEQQLFSSDTHVIEAIGYGIGSDLPLFSKTYALPGVLTPGSGTTKAPGECAALVRMNTTARTIKNHPIYLFNYYHDVFVDTGAGLQDTLSGNQRGVMLSYANAWITGQSDGALTYKRCSPRSAAATTAFVDEYVTHRDFPYTTSA